MFSVLKKKSLGNKGIVFVKDTSFNIFNVLFFERERERGGERERERERERESIFD